MSTSQTVSRNQVPLSQKIAFGAGMLANQMFPASLGIFMVVLVQNLGFPGWMWGTVYFLPRVLDAITDPIMGFISDNTKSIWGRRKQYILLGALVMGIAFSVMWQLYGANSVTYNFTYFLFGSFAFYIGLTIFSVPYVAMGYEMSDDFHERTQIMAIAQWIGQWAWVIAPWFWVIMYDPSWFPSPEAATRELAIWVGVIFALCAMIPAIFIPSKSTLHEDYSPLTVNAIGDSLAQIVTGFKQAFASKPFRKLCISTFFIFNAFNTVAGFVFFIVVWHLFKGNTGDAGYWTPLFGSVGALVTTFLVIPIVAAMSRKIGKKNAFMVSQTIALFGYASLWFLFVPDKPWMFLFSLPFHSFGIGSLFVLMMSMTADVIDLDELNYGKRREGVFGAIYWYMVKFGFAIAGGLSGVILSVVGFDGNAEVQPEGAVDGLRLFFSGLPMFGTIVALYLMHDYDIDEERANQIRAALEKRKKPAPVVSGYVPGKLKALSANDLATTSSLNLSAQSAVELQSMFIQTLHAGIHGLCFSPYIEGQDARSVLSAAQIRRRMEVIMPYTRHIRSFSCTDGNELIPRIAQEKGLKTMVGAWLSDDKARNEQEIQSLIKLAKEGVVDVACVGNEVLIRQELTPPEIIAYLKKVRSQLPAHIPVGYVDAYYQFLEHPELVDAADVILINCYPFWEGADNQQALAYLQRMYQLTQQVAAGKPVIIAETGWPSSGQAVEAAKPSTENALTYFIEAQTWAKSTGVDMFYFSSFDEAWKVQQEGEVGARWGLWDKDETLKYGALTNI
jgi:GPH family glycoside/pentoside/hexuronide:cation symporter